MYYVHPASAIAGVATLAVAQLVVESAREKPREKAFRDVETIVVPLERVRQAW